MLSREMRDNIKRYQKIVPRITFDNAAQSLSQQIYKDLHQDNELSDGLRRKLTKIAQYLDSDHRWRLGLVEIRKLQVP